MPPVLRVKVDAVRVIVDTELRLLVLGVCVCIPLILHHFWHLTPESFTSHEPFCMRRDNFSVVVFAVAEHVPCICM